MVEAKINYYLNERLKPKLRNEIEMYPVLMHFRYGRKASSITLTDRFNRKIYMRREFFEELFSDPGLMAIFHYDWGIKINEKTLKSILERSPVERSTKDIILEFNKCTQSLQFYLLKKLTSFFPVILGELNHEKNISNDARSEYENSRFFVEGYSATNLLGLEFELNDILLMVELYIVVSRAGEIFGNEVNLDRFSSIYEWKHSKDLDNNWSKIDDYDFSELTVLKYGSGEMEELGSKASIEGFFYNLFRVKPSYKKALSYRKLIGNI